MEVAYEITVIPRYCIRYFGVQLTQAREQANMTQEELGELLGFKQQYISKLEAPRVQTREFSASQYQVLQNIRLVPENTTVSC